ncbi:hypothetical protein KIPB_017214, partial [Kipferlia bialata]|eukprot:g17214.t1
MPAVQRVADILCGKTAYKPGKPTLVGVMFMTDVE